MGVAAELGIRPPRRTILDRSGQWFASTTVGAQVMSRVMPAMDTFVMKVTGGRTTFAEAGAGLPTIYLTTRGAKTGLSRTVPLVAVVDGDQLAIIGSNWGRSQHPAWVHNLLADPRATIAWGRHSLPVTARELTGPDADRIWQHARAFYRGFRTYPTRTHGRTIRVFLLEKASS
jgi:deazaflavin-dependent oxidoreductase (nitroreductase family)